MKIFDRLAALLLCTIVVSACGGGGGSGDDPAPPSPPGAGTPPPPPPGSSNFPTSGHIVFENSNSLAVIDLAARQAVTVSPPSTNFDPGLGVSRNGRIADINRDFGDGSWKIDIRTLDLNIVDSYEAGSRELLSSSNSAAVLNADATRLAYSVNEMASEIDDTRIDRIYVYDLNSGNLLTTFDEMSEPVFIDNGELLMRDEDGEVYVADASLNAPASLSIVANFGHATYSASPDGRYIAYEDASALLSQITILDRTTGTSWVATSTGIVSSGKPLFSPDGQWLAFQLSGQEWGTWVHIIPFQVGVTTRIERGGATELKTSTGDPIWASDSYGWAN